MERESEIKKLINVLHRIARSAHYAAWNTAVADAPRFCVKQYNAVLARLTELEPQVAHAFAPLTEDASAQVTRIAARELAAYFEGEAEEPVIAWAYVGGCGSRRRHRARRAWSCQ
jgi:hypothetical protein